MFSYRRYGRHWAVYENQALLCVVLYKKGARAVIERLARADSCNLGDPVSRTKNVENRA